MVFTWATRVRDGSAKMTHLLGGIERPSFKAGKTANRDVVAGRAGGGVVKRAATEVVRVVAVLSIDGTVAASEIITVNGAVFAGAGEAERLRNNG
jgi:hypothetical protein